LPRVAYRVHSYVIPSGARDLPNAADVTQVGEVLRCAQDDTAFDFDPQLATVNIYLDVRTAHRAVSTVSIYNALI
jgi:hypothetical protein